MRTKRITENPFTEIKLLPEKNIDGIVYCTRNERDELIAMAQKSGWPDWTAVPLAFYSGMRREEISRLKWEDIRFKEENITVSKTKTGKNRLIPLSNYL
ncbi:MAG: tyrosine-type recombinase/integrase, partial [Planctomycetota bacterium]|nr:tyrosine-type recombinase/integrase [Planctomycetota bacterium]